MRIDKGTSAILVALLTGLTGLGTAVVNRYTPNDASIAQSEKVSRKGYRVMRSAAKHIAEDVDALSSRIDVLEQSLVLQNKIIEFLMDNNLSAPVKVKAKGLKLPKSLKARKRKRVPTQVRGATPSFDAAQRAE